MQIYLCRTWHQSMLHRKRHCFGADHAVSRLHMVVFVIVNLFLFTNKALHSVLLLLNIHPDVSYIFQQLNIHADVSYIFSAVVSVNIKLRIPMVRLCLRRDHQGQSQSQEDVCFIALKLIPFQSGRKSVIALGIKFLLCTFLGYIREQFEGKNYVYSILVVVVLFVCSGQVCTTIILLFPLIFRSYENCEDLF